MYYVLKVQIKGITKPPVWRRFNVPVNARLSDFHTAIQSAFGWHNDHLHSFEDRSVRWATRYEDDCPTPWDVPEPDLTVKQFLQTVPKPSYVYDFGDWWEHSIKVESIEKGDVDDIECIAGRGARPPEDCGGVWRYESIKHLLASKAPEDDEARQFWMDFMGLESPEDFDPAACEYKPRSPKGK